MSGSMRLLDERHVSVKIELMVWSNKMDLLALSNSKGEVALHRLSWQRVWSLSPPSEGAFVRAMAWRPDGKVIAVAYSNREVLLIDVENKEILHKSFYKHDIISLTWVQEQDTSNEVKGTSAQDRWRSASIEGASKYLPKLPPLSRSFGVNKINNEENLEDVKRIRDQNYLNILLIGQKDGILSLSIFGLFPCGDIDIKAYMKEAGCDSCGAIVDAAVSVDLKVMIVFVQGDEKNNDATRRRLYTVILETPLLASHSRELYTLASKHGHIISLQDYMSSTMQAIVEAWESILLEMDSKLASYAATVADGSVAADFLDLLMLGVPSAELELFLQRDLTEKGLKKLSHSIELSYSNIQKFVLKHVHCVGTSISFHLTELRGMARHVERYALLGLSEETVEAALSSAGAFLVKATEVQQVIDNSLKKYKAFFRWLFLAMLRLTDEIAPTDITKQTQQDLTFIADFLCNFDVSGDSNGTVAGDAAVESNQANVESASKCSRNSVTSGRKSHFNLERLGQYLADQELSILPETENQPWSNLLREYPSLSEDTLIIPHFRKMSLLQQHNHIMEAIETVFKEPAECIGQTFTLQRVVRLPDSANISPLHFDKEGSEEKSSDIFRLTFVYCGDEKKIVVAYPKNETSLHIISLPTHVPRLDSKLPIHQTCLSFMSPISDSIETNIEKLPSPHFRINDMQFYLSDVLSLLLEKRGDDRSAVFLQFPLRVSSGISVTVQGNFNSFHDLPPGDGTNLLDSSALRSIDNFVGSIVAVSGSRKVAVVLSENRCKVRLFEMEIEEDEEEDETMDATVSSIRDSDQSHLLDQSKSSEPDME